MIGYEKNIDTAMSDKSPCVRSVCLIGAFPEDTYFPLEKIPEGKPIVFKGYQFKYLHKKLDSTHPKKYHYLASVERDFMDGRITEHEFLVMSEH